MPVSAKICGFLVVRKPRQNFDREGRGAFPSIAPKIAQLYYGGIDRMPWFDIEEDYYSNNLPPEIRTEFEKLRDANLDLTNIIICRDLDLASRMLSYSNRLVCRNEIIAIHSEKLARIKGAFFTEKSLVGFRGYDVVDLGHWSLLREGLFAVPECFVKWQQRLNSSGLLTSIDDTEEYIRDYKQEAMHGAVEDLAPVVYGIDPIEIWGCLPPSE